MTGRCDVEGKVRDGLPARERARIGRMNLTAVMVSCPERRETRDRTIAHLSATDWQQPPEVVIDDAAETTKIGRIDATWRRALGRAAAADADLVLLLEDDLDFNRCLRENLARWSRVRGVNRNQPFFGSLYNPGIAAVHTRPEACYRVMAPRGCWGAQALVMSPALADYFVRHWPEEDGEPDIRMPKLASRFVPIYYHLPSLVEHVGHLSTWGGRAHTAIDFDRTWRAPAA
jgi:hypothetical protein